jgi:hypothetical protein
LIRIAQECSIPPWSTRRVSQPSAAPVGTHGRRRCPSQKGWTSGRRRGRRQRRAEGVRRARRRVAPTQRLSDALTSSIRALLTHSLAKQRDATAGLRDQPKPRGASVSLSSPPRWGTPTSIGPARTRTARGGGAGRARSAARLHAGAHRAPASNNPDLSADAVGRRRVRPLKGRRPAIAGLGHQKIRRLFHGRGTSFGEEVSPAGCLRYLTRNMFGPHRRFL